MLPQSAYWVHYVRFVLLQEPFMICRFALRVLLFLSLSTTGCLLGPGFGGNGGANDGGTGNSTGNGGGAGVGGSSGGGGAGGSTSTVCGDGIKGPDEACDGDDFGATTCVDFGAHFGGSLTCKNCQIDPSSCVWQPECGNGIIEAGESCDGTDLNGATCQLAGYDSGSLSCNAQCQYDFTGCIGGNPPACGNGKAEGLEACDTADVRSQTCLTFGFLAGELRCDASCNLDMSACVGREPQCGDGYLHPLEECDPIGSSVSHCIEAGYWGGWGLCYPDCTLNTGACVEPTDAFATLLTAVCDYYERCADGWGRMFDSAEDCLSSAAQGPTSGPVDQAKAAECLQGVKALPCGDFVKAVASVPACNNLSVLTPIGEPCRYSDECADNGTCLAEPARGDGCSICTARAALNEPCHTQTCEPGLVCDLTSETCKLPTSVSCTGNSDCCTQRNICYTSSLYCDTGGSDTCKFREAGDPCQYVDWDDCGAPNLVCVNGTCAQPVPTDGPCDSRDDCAALADTCQGGTCQPGLTLGSPCTHPNPCRGHLLCVDGICSDPPGAGEACKTSNCNGDDCVACRSGYACIDSICVALKPDAPPLLPGDTCADATCSYHCEEIYGTCAFGYCDAYGPNATHQCTPYAALGESCINAACNPLEGSCRYNYDDGTTTCVAFTEDGEPCGPDDCRPQSYCNQICHPKQPLGGPCTSWEQCLTGSCYGTCEDGPYVGLPCFSEYNCDGYTCSGTCHDPTQPVSMCAP